MTTKAKTSSLQRDSEGDRQGCVLPRAVLQWLQSLRLSRPVQYPKRDLSNGFLIAEICSHYWKDVPLHSFVNTSSTANKNSNWTVLRKVFDKNKVPLSDKVVDGMVSCKKDYAEAFIVQLYSILTGKEVHAAPPLASRVVEPEPFEPHTAPPLPRNSPPSIPQLDNNRPGSSNSNSNRSGSNNEEKPSSVLGNHNPPASVHSTSTATSADLTAGPPHQRTKNSIRHTPVPIDASDVKVEEEGTSSRIHLGFQHSSRPVNGHEGGSTIIGARSGVTSRHSEAAMEQQQETENAREESLQQAVWNGLLTGSTEAAAAVLHEVGAVHPLVKLCLNEVTLSEDHHFNRYCVAFIGAVLSHVAEQDPPYALTLLKDDVLTVDTVELLLRHLHHLNIDRIASLILAVVGTFHYLSSADVLMRDLLAHLRGLVLQWNRSLPRQDVVCVRVLLLRALVLRLSRTRQNIPESAAAAVRNENSDGEGSVYYELHSESLRLASEAVLAESPKLRFTGTALATALMQSESSPVLETVDALLLLLYPSHGEGQSRDVLFHLMRNSWLCAALRRVSLKAATPHADGVEPDVYPALFCALQDIMVRQSEYVESPGSTKAKAVMATEMGAAAGVLRKEARDVVYGSIAHFLCGVLPETLLLSVLESMLAGTAGEGVTLQQPLIGPLSFADLLLSSPPLYLCQSVFEFFDAQVDEEEAQDNALDLGIHWMYYILVVANANRSLAPPEAEAGEEGFTEWRRLLERYGRWWSALNQKEEGQGELVEMANATVLRLSRDLRGGSSSPEDTEEALRWFQENFCCEESE